MSEKKTVDLQYTPEFKRNLRALLKKYRHILEDIKPIIHELEQGIFTGDQVPGIGYTVFKKRVPNTDARHGKSGGYRMIYYVKTETSVILVTLYSKTEQSDISLHELRRIIMDFDKPSN